MCKNKNKIIPRDYLTGNLFLGFILLSFLFICNGCGVENKKQKEDEVLKTEFWFELERGSLVEVENLRGRKSKSLLPWTVQERITDIALRNNRLYFSVNGYGIFTISSQKKNQFEFKTYYDPDFFTFKTMTTLLPCSREQQDRQNQEQDPEFLCHLYFNSMLFPFQIDELLYDNANIIKLTHTENELFIEELYPVLPEKEPHWEIVRLIPSEQNICYIQWKNSRKSYSEFKYSRYSTRDFNEQEITWEEFLDAYGFISITDPGISGPLHLICEKIMTESGRKKNNTTFHFFVEDKTTHITRRYIHDAAVPITHANFEIVTVTLLEDESGYYGLTDSGYIYRITGKDNNIRSMLLPVLPDNFHYTHFFVHENDLFLAWEESIFVNVGATGLVILKNTNLL